MNTDTCYTLPILNDTHVRIFSQRIGAGSCTVVDESGFRHFVKCSDLRTCGCGRWRWAKPANTPLTSEQLAALNPVKADDGEWPKKTGGEAMSEIVTPESLEASLHRMCDALEAKRKKDIELAVAAEREACAKIAESHKSGEHSVDLTASIIAAEIRGEPDPSRGKAKR